MNKNTILAIIVVVLLGLGLCWFISRTTPQDSLNPIPSPTASTSTTPQVSPISITSPKAGVLTSSPIIVTGTARVFENQLTVQAKDSSGKVVATAHVFTDAKDVGLFGNYTASLQIPVGTSPNLTIEALSYSAKGDGSYEGYASVLVKLK